MKKIFYTFFLIIYCFNLLNYEVYAEVVMNPPSSWAKDFIDQAYKLGIIQSGQFNYQEPITRELFCEFLVQTYEYEIGKSMFYEETSIFADTDNPSILKAYNKKIVNGKSATFFAPNDYITRQEIMAMMVRTGLALEKDLDRSIFIQGNNLIDHYLDGNLFSNWALDQASIAESNGIINGVGNLKLDPLGTTTIEQAIVMLTRLVCIIDASKEDYLLEYNNYITQGKWYYLDVDANFIQDTTFRNIRNADSNFVLKKDGTLYIKPRSNVSDTTQALSTIYENGMYVETAWQKAPINMVHSVSNWYYSGNLLLTKLDGTAYSYDLSTGQLIKLNFSQPIVEIYGYENNVVALASTGQVYIYNNNKETIIDELNSIVTISMNNGTFRGLTKDGQVWESSFYYSPEVLDYTYQTPELLAGYDERLLNYYNKTTDIDRINNTFSDFVEVNEDTYHRQYVVTSNHELYYTENQTFEKLNMSIVAMGTNVLLDESGLLRSYVRFSRAGGYVLDKDNILYNNGDIIALYDNIFITANGNIWQFEYDYNNLFTTHLLGKLSIDLEFTTIKTIVNDGLNILILDTEGHVWTMYNYEQMIQFKITGEQDPIQQFDNISDIANSYLLDTNGKIYAYDPLNISALQEELTSIGESTIFFSHIISNESFTYAIDIEGNGYLLKIPFNIKSEDSNANQMLKLDLDFPLLNIHLPQNIFPEAGIAIANDGKCSLITYEITFDDQGDPININYKAVPLDVYNVKTIYTLQAETIFIKNNDSAWSWYTSIFINDFDKAFGPESAYKKLI